MVRLLGYMIIKGTLFQLHCGLDVLQYLNATSEIVSYGYNNVVSHHFTCCEVLERKIKEKPFFILPVEMVTVTLYH